MTEEPGQKIRSHRTHFNMLGASLLPARFRLGYNSNTAPPSWLNQWISPFLHTLTRQSCTHPIHTIIFILLLASTSYVGFLEGGLANPRLQSSSSAGSIDYETLVGDGRQLKLGQETAWKWQQDSRAADEIQSVSQKLWHLSEAHNLRLRIT